MGSSRDRHHHPIANGLDDSTFPTPPSRPTHTNARSDSEPFVDANDMPLGFWHQDRLPKVQRYTMRGMKCDAG